MSDPRSDEMQEAENWNFDSATVVKPAKPVGAVVSVRFAKDDLAAISKAAEQAGMKTSEFIRTAALDRATQQPHGSISNISPTAGSNVQTVEPANWRRTSGSGRFRIVEAWIGGVLIPKR